MKLLDKGIKYARPNTFNKFESYMDVHKFTRKLNIKRFFHNQHTSNQPSNTSTTVVEFKHSGLKNNSLFNPPGNSGAIDVFKNLVLADLEKIKVKNSNVSKKEQKIVNKIQKRKDLVVRPADKGGGLVLIKKEMYLEELTKQLQDDTTYEKLRGDPTNRFKLKLADLLQEGKVNGILDTKEHRYLTINCPRIPVIYTLPKVHKDSRNPPGRPIVSGIGSLTSRLGEYIDHYLQPLVTSLPAYLRDTGHLLQILDQVENVDDCIIVTADVSSLYTIIPQSEALTSCRFYLDQDASLHVAQRNFILNCLEFCLKYNYFWYAGDFYLQKVGVAMGGKFSPSVANLFMGRWEQTTIFVNQPPELILWRRYIDDCLFIWRGSEESLMEYMTSLNNNNLNIKLTFHHSKSSVDFLDITIYVENHELKTKTFFKASDRNGYIPTASNHHKNWLNNIPKGQFLRMRRNCTDHAQFEEQSRVLKQRFQEKGYASEQLDAAVEEVSKMERNKLIRPENPKNEDQAKDFPISFLSTYNPQYRILEKSIRRHWHVLQADIVLKDILPSKPRFIYRRAPSLYQDLVKNAIDPPLNHKRNSGGFSRCGKCVPCKSTGGLKPATKTFTSSTTNITYHCKFEATCATEGVVYLLQCPCGKQYVGKTKRAFRVRMGEHFRNIKNGLLSHNVSSHFLTHHNCSPLGISFSIIEVVQKNWRGGNFERFLSKREMYWIYTLKTLVPLGLNVDIDINSFLDNS